jgi:hypothetical protein
VSRKCSEILGREKPFWKEKKPCRKGQRVENKTTSWDLCMPREASRKRPPQKKNQGRKRHSREQTLGAKSSANMGAPRRETKTNEEKQGKGRRDLSP